MKLTYEQKRQTLERLAEKPLWKCEFDVERLLANFHEREALRNGETPAPAPENASAGMWLHLTETIDFPFNDFPWLGDGYGADKLRLIAAFDLGLDRRLQADSMADRLGEGATSAFVPWNLTTEFNGVNIALSQRFAVERIDGDSPGLRIRTDVTNKYAILAKAQLFLQAGACPQQEWKGGFLFHTMLKALEQAPALTVAGEERNVWRAFILHTAQPGNLIKNAHESFAANLGLGPDSYAVLDYGGGKLLCAVEQGEHDRLAAAAAISVRALHAIRTGQCDDWQALGWDMAAKGADLKYVDPAQALGREGAAVSELKTLSDMMRGYKRNQLLESYETARRTQDGGSAPPAPAP